MGGLIHSDKDFAHFGHSVAKKLIQQFTTFQRKLPIIETSWQLGVVGKHWTANQEDTGSNPVNAYLFSYTNSCHFPLKSSYFTSHLP